MRLRGTFGLARLFGSAVMSQIVLSAANFGVGILLVRHASDFEYGAYVLALNALMLLTSLQSAFCYPPLAARLSTAAAPEESLSFLFWGAGIVALPVVAVYTGVIYWVFRGKHGEGYGS